MAEAMQHPGEATRKKKVGEYPYHIRVLASFFLHHFSLLVDMRGSNGDSPIALSEMIAGVQPSSIALILFSHTLSGERDLQGLLTLHLAPDVPF